MARVRIGGFTRCHRVTFLLMCELRRKVAIVVVVDVGQVLDGHSLRIVK